MASNPIKQFRGACPHDCPDTCAMIYDVADGKLLGVHGDPDHPMTRGGLCTKANAVNSAAFVNMGHAATFSDNLVEIEKLV